MRRVSPLPASCSRDGRNFGQNRLWRSGTRTRARARCDSAGRWIGLLAPSGREQAAQAQLAVRKSAAYLVLHVTSVLWTGPIATGSTCPSARPPADSGRSVWIARAEWGREQAAQVRRCNRANVSLRATDSSSDRRPRREVRTIRGGKSGEQPVPRGLGHEHEPVAIVAAGRCGSDCSHQAGREQTSATCSAQARLVLQVASVLRTGIGGRSGARQADRCGSDCSRRAGTGTSSTSSTL